MSIRRSLERTAIDPERLARRETRRKIIDDYIGGEEAAESLPDGSLRQGPTLFRSTSDFLSVSRGSIGEHDDGSIVLRRSVATGLALGATAGIIVGINNSGGGGGGAAIGSVGKAAAIGGAVGAGVGYGLSNPPFKR